MTNKSMMEAIFGPETQEDDGRYALEMLENTYQNAKMMGALEGQVLCLLEKSGLLLELGQEEAALKVLLTAHDVVLAHSELTVYLQIAVRVRLARLYGKRPDNAQVGKRLLLRANRLLLGKYRADIFGVAVRYHQWSERAAGRLDWQEASMAARKALEVLVGLPEEAHSGGCPVSFWRARYKLQALWLRVAEQVTLDQDSDMAREIDEAYWTLLQDQDIQKWREAPALAFQLEYVGAWLGYEVLISDVSRFAGWRKQLWWRALRRPPGQRPVEVPLCVRFELPPPGGQESPLIQSLLRRAVDRLDGGGRHDWHE